MASDSDGRDRSLRELFLLTALETYEVILCLDLSTMLCSELYPAGDGFLPREEAVPWQDKLLELLDTVPPEERGHLEEKIAADLLSAREGNHYSATFRSSIRRPDGSFGWWTVLSRILRIDGALNMVMLCNDVTADMLDRQRLLDRSERDGLTGLCNRAKLSELISGSFRNLSSCGILFLDLNELKETNDQYGHDAGDRIIRLVGDSLADLEGPGVTPFRYGGDEFLLIAENASQDEMNRLTQSWILRWRSLRADSEFQPSIAVGIAWAEQPVNVRELIEKADADMYRNKHLMKTGIIPELSSYGSNAVVAGLYGRFDFYTAVRQLLDASEGRRYDMLSLGIGHFSLVNRWYGREVGDKLLGEIGNCILEFSKAHDGLGCYLEGENFAMLLPEEEGLPQQLDAELREVLRRYSSSVGFLLSIGVSHITDLNLVTGSMLELATEARSLINDDAADRVRYYEAEKAAGTQRRKDLLVNLKVAIAMGDVFNWFQPICRPEDGEILGAEALVRWTHLTWGLLEPEDFLPELESDGLTADLDEPLWEQAAALLRDWQAAGKTNVPITLNVSRSDLLSLDVAAVFLRLTEKYGLDRRLLRISVQEQALQDIVSDALEDLRKLREAGFSVELDVSGSFLSLGWERPLPVDGLKVDLHSLPAQGGPGDLGGDILRTLMEEAKKEGLPFTVVGVESRKQAELLRALQLGGVQGYCFHRPMSAEDFSALLKSN